MLNDKALAAGVRVGIVVGFFIGFFRLEQIKSLFGDHSTASTLRSRFDNLMSDPVAQGLEEGKAAARRHLGQNKSS